MVTGRLRTAMLPQKKKSSKKGHKLTKAQRARQQKEEEERKQREEEEARLLAQRQEQERIEREKKLKEIRRLELKDEERREGELEELHHLLQENQEKAAQWKTNTAETIKWERYMRCDSAPDPTEQRDINTYISLWRDDPEVNITQVLRQCHCALQLTEELEVLLEEVSDPQEAQKFQESFVNLQEIIHLKHTLAAEEILKAANKNINPETENMQTEIADDNVTLSLWANLRKRKRFKGFHFEKAGLGFELPKSLAVKDIAVRILHTRYDHLSVLARMTPKATHTPTCSSIGRSKESLGGVASSVMEKKESLKGEVGESDEVQSIHGSEGGKSSESLGSSKNTSGSWESRRSHVLTQMEMIGADSDPTATQFTKTGSDEAVDLMKYTPLGGVFYYGVFHLPPQAHLVNHWEIREIVDSGLKVFLYNPEASSSDDSEASDSPHVGVSVMLPDWVLFLKTPKIALWDAAGTRWVGGVMDFTHQEAEAKVSFRMPSFQPFVLMQETYANLPFQSWELRPLSNNSAMFSIHGALLPLSITVQDNLCMLQSDQERGFAHILGKWMSRSALQRAMVKAGINIFVNEHTDRYVSTCRKDPNTELAAYEQMALFASACAFSWSRWNTKCGDEGLVMQVCEHLSPTPVPEGLWSLYLLGAQRVQRLEMTEKSETFSVDHHPGSEFHSTFIHMLRDRMSPEGAARTRKSGFQFVEAVQGLLCSTRPLRFSS
ncbi:protein CASC1 isoform X1 [Oryzias melastigma]|uniref:Dynein axonemal intermediate chain 7 n=1 Tax=Oryzias melastigma TaxID=30732 RepID=A0A3B3B6I9_ORYME|nr:protein CASC1 isoform X1 [Oryzias melastigma]